MINIISIYIPIFVIGIFLIFYSSRLYSDFDNGIAGGSNITGKSSKKIIYFS